MSELQTTTKPLGIYKALLEIKRDIGHIVKESQGVHGPCRSVYDTYLATHDPFLKHGVLTTCGGLKDGNMEWTFHCVEDGSTLTTSIPMIDSVTGFFDAGNAVSYSHKYAIISTLSIPDKSVNQNEPDIQGDTKKQTPFDQEPKESKPIKKSNGHTKPVTALLRTEILKQFPDKKNQIQSFFNVINQMASHEGCTLEKFNELVSLEEMVIQANAVINQGGETDDSADYVDKKPVSSYT